MIAEKTLTDGEREQVEQGRREFGSVLSLLRGSDSLWHRTSLAGLRGILEAACIYPNDGYPKAGRFPMTYGQSRLSYGRAINAISLFNFDSATEEEILLHSWKWGPFLTDQRPITVWIDVPRSRLDSRLLSSSLDFKGNRLPYIPTPAGEEHLFPRDTYIPTFIPYVEAWHRGPIAAELFVHFLVFGRPQLTVEYGYVSARSGALEAISAIAQKWERSRLERATADEAAGKIDLSKIIKQADALAESRRRRKPGDDQ